MSDLLFPMPIAPQGNWTWPIKKTPSFKTIVQTPANNRGENRISLTPFPIWIFNFDFSYLKGDMQQLSSAVQNLVGFFGYVQGQANDWLFEDPFDHTVTKAKFGTGDGATTTFQLARTIGLMTDIIQNFAGVPQLFSNGNPIAASAFTLSSTGVVQFTNPPAIGAVLTWSGNFFYRCRFLDDEWTDLEEFMYQIWEHKNVRFKSVIL